LHDGKGRIPTADAIHAGERVSCGSRGTVARSRNDDDHNDLEDGAHSIRG
jgi:hypothetical protein